MDKQIKLLKFIEKSSTLKALEKNNRLKRQKTKHSKIKKMFEIYINLYRSQINYIFFKHVNFRILNFIDFFIKYNIFFFFFAYSNNWTRLKIKIFRSIKKRIKKKIIKKNAIKR